MIRVWRFGDKDIPAEINQVSNCGGDEDWVIAGPNADPVAFEMVCQSILTATSGESFKPEWATTVSENGVNVLVYTVCHA